MALDKTQKGKISLENFGKEINALFVVPYVQADKASDYSYFFSWAASIRRDQGDEAEIEKLLLIIDGLKKKIAEILAQNGQSAGQCAITSNLFLGMENNAEVMCLQRFLKLQGPDVYPEGLVTSNFRSLTRQAVIRFQQKYISEILTPAGLSAGTGFVGERTRAKISQLW